VEAMEVAEVELVSLDLLLEQEDQVLLELL
jgi:hypothetical protein